jgi:hypothetical protein
MSLLETSGKERQEKIKERVNKQTRVEVIIICKTMMCK